jgi:hypothetical protein
MGRAGQMDLDQRSRWRAIAVGALVVAAGAGLLVAVSAWWSNYREDLVQSRLSAGEDLVAEAFGEASLDEREQICSLVLGGKTKFVALNVLDYLDTPDLRIAVNDLSLPQANGAESLLKVCERFANQAPPVVDQPTRRWGGGGQSEVEEPEPPPYEEYLNP